MAHKFEEETTVTESYSTTVPASIRRALGIEAGDTLRWQVDEEGQLSVEVLAKPSGGVGDLDPVDVGADSDADEDHDLLIDDGEYEAPDKAAWDEEGVISPDEE